PAPRKRFPSSRRQVFNSGRRETSIMTSGLLRSKFRSPMRSVPPAIGTASGWAAFSWSASSSPRGMRTSIKARSASELPLREGIDHREHVVAERIQDRAGAPGVNVLTDLGPALVRWSRGRDHLDHFVGNEVHGASDLLLRRRPGEDPGDLIQERLIDATRLPDMRLLSQVLRNEFSGPVERGLAVLVERAHHELRAVHFLQ